MSDYNHGTVNSGLIPLLSLPHLMFLPLNVILFEGYNATDISCSLH